MFDLYGWFMNEAIRPNAVSSTMAVVEPNFIQRTPDHNLLTSPIKTLESLSWSECPSAYPSSLAWTLLLPAQWNPIKHVCVTQEILNFNGSPWELWCMPPFPRVWDFRSASFLSHLLSHLDTMKNIIRHPSISNTVIWTQKRYYDIIGPYHMMI